MRLEFNAAAKRDGADRFVERIKFFVRVRLGAPFSTQLLVHINSDTPLYVHAICNLKERSQVK